VRNTPIEVPAAARARWLAELAETLDEAQRLLARLDLSGHQQASSVELFLRIEAARHEIESLRVSRQSRAHSDPERTNPLPWQDGERTAR
jgi:hypothetical protein